MIKAVIVEDEDLAILNLQSLLKEFSPEIKVVDVFKSGREALQKLPETEFDLLFLDIQFNDDFDAFEMLKAWQFKQLNIIFVTSYNQYAIKAFKYNAIDYVTKPIDKTDLQQAIVKAKKRIFNKNEIDLLLKTVQAFRNSQIAIKGQNETLFLVATKILFFKAEKDYSTVAYVNDSELRQTIITSKHLGFWETELSAFPFVRIHKSHLVNMDRIQSFGSKKIKLTDGTQLEIARDRRKEVEMKILVYKTK